MPGNQNNLIIFVEGNISTGKEKFINDLSKLLASLTPITKIYTHMSNIPNNNDINIFDLFACNPSKWTAEYFMTNLTMKLKFMKEHLKDNNSILLVERSLLTESKVFVKSLHDSGLISDMTYKICMEHGKEISDIILEMQSVVCYIYLRTDPVDLFNNIIINNVFDSINFELINAIHFNYELYFQSLDSNNFQFISIDLPYEQMFKPHANTIKGAFRQLQNIYPIFQNY